VARLRVRSRIHRSSLVGAGRRIAYAAAVGAVFALLLAVPWPTPLTEPTGSVAGPGGSVERPRQSVSRYRPAVAALPTPAQLLLARRFARGRAGLVSFAVVDTAGRLRCHACRRRYVTGSVIKAMLLVSYLERVAAERRPLSAGERDLLEPMIRESDNDAADDVYYSLGDAPLYRLAERAGMRRFDVYGYWGNAMLTAADQARFMARIDRLVARRHRAFARALLCSIVPWQSWGIPRVSRPRGWRTFFKGGWRLTASGELVHQIALLERAGVAITIAVLTNGNPSHGYGRGTVRGIAARLLGGPAEAAGRRGRRAVGSGTGRVIVVPESG
jgi:hypothetical protein